MKLIDLDNLEKEARQTIEETTTVSELEAARVKYLGRRGLVGDLLGSLGNLSLEEKKEIGPRANKLKKDLLVLFEKQLDRLKQLARKHQFDLTLPGRRVKHGHLHILTKAIDDIQHIFRGMGFSVVEGSEVDSDFYNFDTLNVPQNHPARDMWDTLWLKPMEKGLLMRTHTSPTQIHFMKKHRPPFQIIVPGKVYRHEATDFSHEFNFNQLEGMMVGERVSMANLKYVISRFFADFYKRKIEVRFRPSYFPFTEPSVEVDVKMLKGGWLEMGGAGMVHPEVFKNVGYVPDDQQGFAFGFGIERLVMIKYGIPDVRLFNSGDLRFINQF